MRKVLRFAVKASHVNVIEIPASATFVGVEGRTEASVYFVGDPEQPEKRKQVVVVVPTGRFDLDTLNDKGMDPSLLVHSGILLAGLMPGAHARYEHVFLTDQPLDSGFPLFPQDEADADAVDADA